MSDDVDLVDEGQGVLDESALHDTLDSLLAAYESLVERVDVLEARSEHGKLDPAAFPDWVEWLRTDYALGPRIPDDWSEIPGVRHELEALWAAWESSYTDERVPRRAFDAVQWHDALQRVPRSDQRAVDGRRPQQGCPERNPASTQHSTDSHASGGAMTQQTTGRSSDTADPPMATNLKVLLAAAAVAALVATGLIGRALLVDHTGTVRTWAEAVATGDCRAAEPVSRDLDCDDADAFNAWSDMRSRGLTVESVEESQDWDDVYLVRFTNSRGHLVTLSVELEDGVVTEDLPGGEELAEDHTNETGGGR